MSMPPTFSKELLDEPNEVMKIPTGFVQGCIEERKLPEIVSLKDRCNNIWHVKASKLKQYWYFTQGWSKLVSDCSITKGDVMKFKYESEGLFTFEIDKRQDIEEQANNVPRYEINREDELVEITREASLQSGARARQNIVQESRDEGNGESDDHPSEEDDDLDDAEGANESPRIVDFDGKCYGMEIFRAGLAPQLRNPYFVSRIYRRVNNGFYVPRRFIKDHEDLDLTQPMCFVEPSGRRYKVEHIRPNSAQFWLGGSGWRALCDTNRATAGDTYICEFIQRANRRLLLRITFIR